MISGKSMFINNTSVTFSPQPLSERLSSFHRSNTTEFFKCSQQVLPLEDIYLHSIFHLERYQTAWHRRKPTKPTPPESKTRSNYIEPPPNDITLTPTSHFTYQPPLHHTSPTLPTHWHHMSLSPYITSSTLDISHPSNRQFQTPLRSQLAHQVVLPSCQCTHYRSGPSIPPTHQPSKTSLFLPLSAFYAT